MDINRSDVERRQAALQACGADPFSATAFADLTRTAADLLDAPIAAISVLDYDGGDLKAAVGIAGGKRSADAFAPWALCRPTSALVVPDVSKDPELQKALSVAGLANVRFYAAIPLTLSTGQAIGALCVMRESPRTVPDRAIDELRFLADQVIRTLEERRR